jgi:hypothetical protein
MQRDPRTCAPQMKRRRMRSFGLHKTPTRLREITDPYR